MVVPVNLNELLLERIGKLPGYLLGTFLSYRSNASFSQMVLNCRPDILDSAQRFGSPIHEDSDARLLVSLLRQKVLPGSWRDHLATKMLEALVAEADPSVFEMNYVETILHKDEQERAVILARDKVLTNIPHYVSEVRSGWSKDYPPDDHFDTLQSAIRSINDAVERAEPDVLRPDPMALLRHEVRRAVDRMEEDYEPQSSTSAPVASSTPQSAALHSLFRDVDE